MSVLRCTAFWWSLFITAMLFCSDSFAVLRKPFFLSPYVYRYNYGASMLFGQGQMGNNTTIAPYRDMDYTTVQGFLGFRISHFRFSVVGEYSYVIQTTNVVEVANTNLKGQSFAYGPKFEFYDGQQAIGFIYRLRSTYDLKKVDINYEKQQYNSTTGFNIQYTRRIKGKVGFVIDYAREEYGRSLPDRISWDRLSIGITYSNFDKKPYPLP